MNEWQIVERLVVAALLSGVIGLEREVRHKSAGLRTHALVGLGAALFMCVSQIGFYAVIAPGRIVLDPSRVAAQVVSGIGFLGAGLIFRRRENDTVSGLTTAAGVWVCAAIGLACGGGLLLSATSATMLSVGIIVLSDRMIEHFMHADRRAGEPAPAADPPAGSVDDEGDH
jgi:putative Mg2+ transporter-C (MgtC) family protein